MSDQKPNNGDVVVLYDGDTKEITTGIFYNNSYWYDYRRDTKKFENEMHGYTTLAGVTDQNVLEICLNDGK